MAVAVASALERLHLELLDLVVDELVSVSDISALRLTCRTLAARVAQSPALRPYVARKTVELTVRDLETLVAMTESDCPVGHQLQHLTLKGIARNKTAVYMSKYSDLPPPSHPEEDPEQDQDTLLRNVPEEDSDDHKRLLTAALSNIRKYGRLGGLASLTLIIGPSTKPRAIYIVPRHKRGAGTFPEEVDAGIGGGGGRGSESDPGGDGDGDNDGDYVAPYELPYRPSWRSVWDAAESTFGVAMHALTTAQLPVADELDIFHSIVGVALPFDAFLSLTCDPAAVPRPIFSSLKRLKVHLSLRHRSAAEERNVTAAEVAREEREVATDEFNENLIISQLQAQFEAAHRAQLHAEWAAARRVLETITAPSELARVMPALEAVSVDWYHIGRNMIIPTEKELASSSSSSPLQKSTSSAPDGPDDKNTRPLPRLHALSLHGIRLDGAEFLKFIDTARPEYLSLCYPQFIPSSFEPVLRYLTDPDLRDSAKSQAIKDLDARLVNLRPSPVRRFKLDDIMDGYALVHYNVPGRPKFRYLHMPDLGPCTLVRPDPSLDTTAPMTQAVAAALPSVTPPDSPDAVDFDHQEEEGAVLQPPPARPLAVAAATGPTTDDPPGGVRMVRPHTRPLGSGSRWRWARQNGNVYGPPRARYDLQQLNSGMVPKPHSLTRMFGDIRAAAGMTDRLERREAAVDMQAAEVV
ncbi:uncharacterized protein SPSK_08761 [Sporothrix schenckii 1099-18]|uniref:Uncharacterized protein n=2 Tax=Sporothrix schenckii TaxID=29908 RepID=U7Q7U6_SPOS1|nr:uncharacterized protein SPSK_08761 [Sporothrix schenckii 1099-18]ERT02821.1 hypothetical protein HMPREF1624_01124 [Sporothrix schenckii ATCC 58251]KJR84845.1 hypothetical protein SPSK_08761 [Sporothrix schenckii 1099-18]